MSECDSFENNDNYQQNYAYNPDDDISSVSSVNTNIKNNRKFMDEFDKKDTGCYKVKRFFDNKKKEIKVYSTNTTPGCTIRDGSTGASVGKYYVGKCDENLFFKVRLTSEPLCGDRPITLFYDNPEHYERHLKTIVNKDTKEKWLKKYMKERLRRE